MIKNKIIAFLYLLLVITLGSNAIASDTDSTESKPIIKLEGTEDNKAENSEQEANEESSDEAKDESSSEEETEEEDEDEEPDCD